MYRQAGEGPQRGRVANVERQLFVAQLTVLLQQRAAQDRFCRQTLAAGRLDPVPAQVNADRAEQLAMIVQPIGHRLQLTTKLVLRENIEYTGLDGAFFAHCRLRR